MKTEFTFHKSNEQARIDADVGDDRPDISWLKIYDGPNEVTYFFKTHNETRALIDALSKTLPPLEYADVTDADRHEAWREDSWDRLREERELEKRVRAETPAE